MSLTEVEVFDPSSRRDAESAAELFMRQLRRLTAAGRFGPFVLHWRGGAPIDVRQRGEVLLDPLEGMIVIAKGGESVSILAEDILAIELRARGKIEKNEL